MSAHKANLEILPRGVQVALGLALIALLAFPFVGTDFYTQMVTRMMIMAIFAMSLDLLQGVTGLVSLGHAAYFGLAGYALAFLTPQGEAKGDLHTARQDFEVCFVRAHALKSPSGFHSKTAAISMYTSMPATDGSNTLPKVSTSPTSSAAIIAPRTEPMPPITTTTKHMISTCEPMFG